MKEKKVPINRAGKKFLSEEIVWHGFCISTVRNH